MPTTRCNHPRCPGYGTAPGGYCPTHATEYKPRKMFAGCDPTSITSKHYNRQWSAFSKAFLSRNPVCVLCGRPSESTDHFAMSASDMVRQYGKFILDPSLYRALCTSCNTKQRWRRPPARLKPKKGRGVWTNEG